MKELLPLGLLGGAIYLFTKDKKPATPVLTLPYFKDNGFWLCLGNKTFEGFDLTNEVIKNSSLYDKLFKNITPLKENGYNLREIATKALKQRFKGFKTVQPEISILDSFTIRYFYVMNVLSAAAYLALTDKVLDLELATWLTINFPQELMALGLLLPGVFELNSIKPVVDPILNSPEELSNALDKMYILLPKFKEIQPELLASILMISFSQVISLKTKDKCISITDLKYGDFTSLSGKIDPYFQNLYNTLFDAAVKAKNK
jgi:hypothetical protein